MLGIAETLPRRAPKKEKPTRRGTCYWIERNDGAVLLRRRPEKGLLGGMMEVPSSGWSDSRSGDAVAQAPVHAKWIRLNGGVSHTFTHFHLKLEIWKADAVADGEIVSDGDYRWVPQELLPGEALPSVMRKVCAAVLGAA